MKRLFSLFIIILAAGSLSAQTLSDTLVLDGSAVVAQKNLVKMAKKMKVYTGTEHEHAAQQPEKLDL